MTTELDQIQLRRDTAANWTALNPVLASGEVGFETDTFRFKIGNGVLAWAAIAYQGGGGGGGGELTVNGSLGSPNLVPAAGSIPNLNYQRELCFVSGTPGPVTCGNPQIVAGLAIGQELIVRGCNSTNWVKINSGTGMLLNGPCTLFNGGVISLVWDGFLWVEVARNGMAT